ncbi:hypothetical protein H6G97_14620 [Nostoc flagelliforme FACHB-838]|uniref:Uncharacterized protein n=1 Tax=Nostoc flagelliforme FACHB-838 TaxID=2692904 RepID=A0ABR8DPA5_9NOSO|nr:hypothetical protein [Nostoc flagelliforme]MBD2530741.1 hypothetical protein [Nostoc flagelliforme FACHB-838]
MLFQQNQKAMAQAPAVGDRKCSPAVHSLIAITFLTSPPYAINWRSLKNKISLQNHM